MIDKNEGNIRSVIRALKLLQCFSLEHLELTFTEIAQKTGLSKSTASRILATLESEKFLLRDPDTGKYKLGNIIYLLGLVAKESMDLISISKPYLEAMTKETNETSNLYVLDNLERVCVAQVESPKPLKRLVKVGERFPVWGGATGRSILAFLDESYWHRMVKELKGFTEKTIVNPEEFIDDLKKIKENGYSVSMGEKFDEIGCIAAPIFDDSNVIGSISISGPVYRFPDDLTDLINLVRDSAIKISNSLGYKEKKQNFLE